MTRFARARGSKSSNERVPQEATPWHVMRKQLEEQTQAETGTSETQGPVLQHGWKKSLAREDLLNVQETWSEFGVEKTRKIKKLNTSKAASFKQEKPLENTPKPVKHNTKDRSVGELAQSCNEKQPKEPQNKAVIKMKSKKVKGKQNIEEINDETSKISSDLRIIAKEAKKQKKSKKQKMHTVNEEHQNKSNNSLESSNLNLISQDIISVNKQNSMQHNTNKTAVMLTNKSKDSPNKFNNKHFVNADNKRKKHDQSNEDFKRRKPDQGDFKIVVNGVDIHVVRYEGFYIKKNDAIELHKLRKKLKAKGVSKPELQKIMQLERRKAEKNLAREKKKVCFHCRKSGHNLSDCPDLDSQNSSTSTGICFKCGSTEHTHFECKVTRGQDFRFAQCFVCKEQGHIAKQCPDNPRGLYPKGGACRVCGDVTHLKKDCPKLVQEKSIMSTLTVETLKGDALEVLDVEKIDSRKHVKRLNKIIKF